MESRLCFFSFIVFIVLISAPLTFSFWTKETGLPNPEPGTILSCVGWITFYGFKEDDFNFNNAMAKNRHVPYDKDASTWAAMYAYELSGSFHEDDFLPGNFCEQHEALDSEYSFLKLKDERKTCKDWLFLYGYTDDVRENNRPKVLARNPKLDKYIYLLVDGYNQAITYIYSLFYFNMSPTNYCLEMGQIEGSVTQFMSRLNTQHTCERWIKLYGFTDSGEDNYEYIQTKLTIPTRPFTLFRPKVVKLYSDKLKNNNPNFAESPKHFCRTIGYDDDETDFFKPLKFELTIIPGQEYSISTTYINRRR